MESAAMSRISQRISFAEIQISDVRSPISDGGISQTGASAITPEHPVYALRPMLSNDTVLGRETVTSMELSPDGSGYRLVPIAWNPVL